MAKSKSVKPPVITAGDSSKFSQSGAIEMLRKLAEECGWTLGYAVFTAAEHFKPRLPAEVGAAEIASAIPALVEKGKVAKAAKAAEAQDNGHRADVRDRMDVDCREKWELGRWKGLFPIRVLLERCPTGPLTTALLDGLAAELKARKAADEAVIDERPDPYSGPVSCASPVHRGEEREFQPTVAFRVKGVDGGALVRMKFPKGDDYMIQGNFLEIDARGVPYCADCREMAKVAVWEAKDSLPALQEAVFQASPQEKDDAKSRLKKAEDLAGAKLTFYTAAGVQRKLDAIKRSAESQEAFANQLKTAGQEKFGTQFFGSRKVWRGRHSVAAVRR